MRPFTALLLLCCTPLLQGCVNDNQQTIDLSDSVVAEPEDGVGHYVYSIVLPRRVHPGEKFDAQMEWRTVGSVDPNARYTMDAILKGPRTREWSMPPGANTVGELHLANWLNYTFEVPEDFPPGTYTFGIRLTDEVNDGGNPPLGFLSSLRMEDGYYRLGEIEVIAADELDG